MTPAVWHYVLVSACHRVFDTFYKSAAPTCMHTAVGRCLPLHTIPRPPQKWCDSDTICNSDLENAMRCNVAYR